MTSSTKTYLIQCLLFIATAISTTLSGAVWRGQVDLQGWDFFWSGLNYSIPFLGILTIHEFGHYFLAKRYGVDTTLPYFLPLPFSIGTLGAFIRMKSQPASKKAMFDIGIAGPLAGFIAALAILVYGFTHLPSQDYIFSIHPLYAEHGKNYKEEVYNYAHFRLEDSLAHEKSVMQDSLQFIQEQKEGKREGQTWERKKFKAQDTYQVISLGNNMLFWALGKLLVEDETLLPSRFELYHYPVLFAGYLALFFTALNLLPIGQLDGGHVIYGLFGYKKHRVVSLSAFSLFVFIAGIGMFKDNLLGINFFNSSPTEMILFAGAYLYFLYSMFERSFPGNKTTAMLIAATIFAAQFLVEFLWPSFEGLSGGMIFAYLIGRFLGIDHPPAAEEQALDWKRKVLGWIALVIFVLCFSPGLFHFQTFTP